MRDDIVARIEDSGIIPVIRAPSAELAMRAVDAIRAGGIDIVEVTMTVPGAIPLIQSLVSRYGRDVVIGTFFAWILAASLALWRARGESSQAISRTRASLS